MASAGVASLLMEVVQTKSSSSATTASTASATTPARSSSSGVTGTDSGAQSGAMGWNKRPSVVPATPLSVTSGPAALEKWAVGSSSSAADATEIGGMPVWQPTMPIGYLEMVSHVQMFASVVI